MASTLARMFGSGRSATFLGLPAEASRPDIVLMGADTATRFEGVGAYCAGGADAIRAGAVDFATKLGHMDLDLGGLTGADSACVLDWDVLDPEIMPAVIARIPVRAAHSTAVEDIAGLATPRQFVAGRLAGFTPERDSDGQGARTAAGLVATTLGCIARARAGV